MDFAADPELDAIAEAVRDACRAYTDEYWLACDEEKRFPYDFYRDMAAAGWVGLAIPEEFGGGGRGIREAAVVLHEIAASGAAMNGCTPIHMNIFALEPVVRFGTERLRQEILPRAARGDLQVAFGVTEPNAGANLRKIATRADHDGSVWRISGQKVWTSKAQEADEVLLLTRTGPPTGDQLSGLTLFLAPLDRRYVSIRPIPKLGRNAVSSCETFYEHLPVEDWRVVGEVGNGFRHLTAALNPERIVIAAEAIGIGRAALRRAVSYASTREVFDRPIGAHQAISHPLADAYARLEAAWQLVQLAAWRYDHGLPCAAEANTAKYLAAEASFLAADRALQTLGGFGYAKEFHVERYWREARLMRIAPISQEMTLNYLAHNVLKLPRSY